MKTYFHHDNVTGKNVIEYEQDMESAVERSKFLASKLNKKEDWWPIGHIKDVTILQWAKECSHKPYTKEWNEYAVKQLNKSEYSRLNPNRIKL